MIFPENHIKSTESFIDST